MKQYVLIIFNCMFRYLDECNEYGNTLFTITLTFLQQYKQKMYNVWILFIVLISTLLVVVGVKVIGAIPPVYVITKLHWS